MLPPVTPLDWPIEFWVNTEPPPEKTFGSSTLAWAPLGVYVQPWADGSEPNGSWTCNEAGWASETAASAAGTRAARERERGTRSSGMLRPPRRMPWADAMGGWMRPAGRLEVARYERGSIELLAGI